MIEKLLNIPKISIVTELYRRGNYDLLDIFDKQKQAITYLTDNTTTDMAYGGAARGGKSVLGCKWVIMECLSKPKSRWLVAREELTKLRDTTMDTFFKELSGFGLIPKVDYNFNGSSFTLLFSNGSKVFFGEIKYIPSDSEFDRLGSYDLTGAFLDEAQQIHIKAINVLRGRFSELEGKGWKTIPKMYFSCNPSKNWLYSDFYKPNKQDRLIGWRKFVQALPTDNPHNSKEYLSNMLKSDNNTVQRLYYGNWDYDNDPAALIDWDSIQDLFTNEHVLDDRKRYLTCDIAMQGSDRFVICAWRGWIVDKIYIIDKSDGKEVFDTIQRVARENQVPRSQIAFDNDGLGSGLSGFLKGAYAFHNGAKPVYQVKKTQDKYRNLKSQCYFHFARKVVSKEVYFKARISVETRESLETELSWVKDRSIDTDDLLEVIRKKDLVPEIGRSPDLTDALMMRSIFDLKRKQGVVITRN